MARTAEEVIKLVPDGLRESSLALGAPQWKTVMRIVLPAARSGLVTATVLGVSRIAGETAPLLMTAFGSDSVNTNPFEGPQSSLPLFAFQRVRAALPTQIARGWAGALVLIVLVLSLFTAGPGGRRPRQKGSLMTDIPTADVRIDTAVLRDGAEAGHLGRRDAAAPTA